MAATEKTENYGLPIYKEDDTTTWADYNQSMQLIDAQMKRNADAAASGGDIPADVEQRLDSLEENDKILSQALTGVANQTGKNTTDIRSLQTASSEQGSELSSLSGSVSALSSTTADHETRIHAVELSASENHSDIVAAEQRIAVNENEIAIFNTEISENQTNIAALQVDNTKNKQDIANLQTWQEHALPGVLKYSFKDKSTEPLFYTIDSTGGLTQFTPSAYSQVVNNFYGMQYGENEDFQLRGELNYALNPAVTKNCVGIRITISSMDIPVRFVIRQPCVGGIFTQTASRVYIPASGQVIKNANGTSMAIVLRWSIENISATIETINIYF